jgi:hypothetical protein
MLHSLGNPDRDFSASQIDTDLIEKLFASPPLSLDRLFDDPMVQKRIGEIISLAASRPSRLPRRRRSNRAL